MVLSVLPECLKRPLKFGDDEQIHALRQITAEIKRNEEHNQKVKEGILKKYRVIVALASTVDMEICAVDEKDARSIARYDVEDPMDWEIDYVHATEIKDS